MNAQRCRFRVLCAIGSGFPLRAAARIARLFRRYGGGGVFFHGVPTKRGSAGACSGSTSLLGKPRNRVICSSLSLALAARNPQINGLHKKKNVVAFIFLVGLYRDAPHGTSVYQIFTRLGWQSTFRATEKDPHTTETFPHFNAFSPLF